MKEKRANLLDVETYEDTFGNSKKRKRPRLTTFTYSGLFEKAKGANDNYTTEKDKNLTKFVPPDLRDEARDKRHEAG